MLDGKRVIVTGGTGSLGQVLVRRLLEGEVGVPEEVVVFSRSEALQHSMRLAFQHRRVATDDIVYDEERHQRLHFRIGDIRDYAAVSALLRDADVVFHAAAMKQVPTCEYHPIEAFMTNAMGAQNIARAISEQQLTVDTVVGISTDKACKPVNVMGMTKALQERILLEANLQSPSTRFIVARYGNVLASRGSVIPVFSEQIEHGGPVTVTTPEMTRFLLSLDEAVDTVFAAVRDAPAGRDLRPSRADRPHGRRRQGDDRRPGDRDRVHGHPAGREDPRGPGVRGGGAADLRPRANTSRSSPSCPSSGPRKWRASRIRVANTARRTTWWVPTACASCSAPRHAPGRSAAARAMKVLIVLGTRPEIIRLSPGDRAARPPLRPDARPHRPELRPIAQRRLLRGARRAGARSLPRDRGDGFADRVGRILAGVDPVLTELEPDRLLVLGDTDSGLSAYVAKRRGVPVFHMEAGNRCFDDRVPEEVNRRVIDHSSDVLMPYTNRSRDNLLREGVHPSRILVTGNPIKEVMDTHAERSTHRAPSAISARGRGSTCS